MKPTKTSRRLRDAADRAGFTLVELLVALALTTIFLTMVATIFTQSQGAFSRARATTTMAQEAYAIFDLMRRDLAAATLVTYTHSGASTRGYFGANKGIYANDPPGPPAPTPTARPQPNQLPRLYFVSASRQAEGVATVVNAPEPFMVAYKLVWSGRNKNRLASDGTQPTPPARGVYRLQRRITKAYEGSYKYRDLDALPVDSSGVTAEPVGFSVLWVEYRFLDSDTGLWTADGDWTTTTKLPLMVEVKLVMTDPERREEATYTARFRLSATSVP